MPTSTKNLDPFQVRIQPIDKSRPPYSVLVADDHPLVREGLIALINRRSDMRVVAEASNGCEAVEKFLARRPDIALLDLRMPISANANYGWSRGSAFHL
jgi:CheY-like chemotaxis protein